MTATLKYTSSLVAAYFTVSNPSFAACCQLVAATSHLTPNTLNGFTTTLRLYFCFLSTLTALTTKSGVFLPHHSLQLLLILLPLSQGTVSCRFPLSP